MQRRDRHLTKAERQKERLDARAFKVRSPLPQHQSCNVFVPEGITLGSCC